MKATDLFPPKYSWATELRGGVQGLPETRPMDTITPRHLSRLWCAHGLGLDIVDGQVRWSELQGLGKAHVPPLPSPAPASHRPYNPIQSSLWRASSRHPWSLISLPRPACSLGSRHISLLLVPTTHQAHASLLASALVSLHLECSSHRVFKAC